MKEVILSADGDSYIYLVPDIVAQHLKAYCIQFCDKWMKHSIEGQRFKTKWGYSYDVSDFIDCLNTYIFTNEKSVLVKNLKWTDFNKNLPKEYQNHPYFNF